MPSAQNSSDAAANRRSRASERCLAGGGSAKPNKIAAAALYRDIGMASDGRSALVGMRDRVRTRNASCTPRLVHVSADGVLAAQLLTCNRAICPFLPFRALRCAARNWPVYRDFTMARPGLEPGTPRFSDGRREHSATRGSPCKSDGWRLGHSPRDVRRWCMDTPPIRTRDRFRVLIVVSRGELPAESPRDDDQRVSIARFIACPLHADGVGPALESRSVALAIRVAAASSRCRSRRRSGQSPECAAACSSCVASAASSAAPTIRLAPTIR